MKVLYDLINDKTLKKWPWGNITKENFKDWRQLWIDTASELQDRFHEEGLRDTAIEIGRMIDYEKGYNYERMLD